MGLQQEKERCLQGVCFTRQPNPFFTPSVLRQGFPAPTRPRSGPDCLSTQRFLGDSFAPLRESDRRDPRVYFECCSDTSDCIDPHCPCPRFRHAVSSAIITPRFFPGAAREATYQYGSSAKLCGHHIQQLCPTQFEPFPQYFRGLGAPGPTVPSP